MPGKVKVRIIAGRNLPVMDRAADTTDAYVEVKLGNVTHKTDVFRKSLNPQWNSEWFRFEVDDHDLQDEPLQIRLMDHDTYSANDAIGKVYVDLNPLLLPPPLPVLGATTLTSKHLSHVLSSSSGVPGVHESSSAPVIPPPQPAVASIAHQTAGAAVMSGWLPVYDTMHGLRGEVAVTCKVDLFSDFNRFRQSSCGVHFFFSPEIPDTFSCQRVVGLVEELVKNHDPEYEWIDKIRSPRASNEAKQTLFCKLSGLLQRKIGLKVLDMGGNAVLGYRQCFDLEGESGIVVRGLGTAVVLTPAAAITITSTNHHHLHHTSATIASSHAAAFTHHYHHHHPGGAGAPKQMSSPQGITSAHHNQQSSPLPSHPAVSCSVATAPPAATLGGAAVISPHSASGVTSANVSGVTSAANASGVTSAVNASGVTSAANASGVTSVAIASALNNASQIDGWKKSALQDGAEKGSAVCSSEDYELSNLSSSENSKNCIIKNKPEKSQGKITKQSAVDNRDDALKANGCLVENGPHGCESLQCTAESRKIQRTATVIEQETVELQVKVETSSTETEPNKCGMADPPTTEACDTSNVLTDVAAMDGLEPLATPDTPPATTHAGMINLPHAEATTVNNHRAVAAQPRANSSHVPASESGSDNEGVSAKPWTGVSPSNPFFSGVQVGSGVGAFVRRPLISHEALAMLKYPFFTMTNFPTGFILRIGGTVSARCVKLLERSHAAPVEVESRDSWWAQLRGEVRMHCATLACNAVLGYTEFTTICDDVCILNVSGTAAIVSVSNESLLAGGFDDYGPSGYFYSHHPVHQYPVHQYPGPVHQYPGLVHHSSSFEKKETDAPSQAQGGSLRCRQTSVSEDGDIALGGSAGTPHRTQAAVATGVGMAEPLCCVCHSPFADAAELPFKVAISKCALCKHGKVTDILLATIEPPPGVPITGRGCLVQARVFKHRRDLKGEAFAKEVSDALPFVEYEITKLILNKVRIAGMNAIFGLRVRLSLGERLVVAVASGTAVFLTALPPPLAPQVVVDSNEGEEVRRHWQQRLSSVMRANSEHYGVLPEKKSQRRRPSSRNAPELWTQSSDSEDDDAPGGSADTELFPQGTPHSGPPLDIDFSAGNKEACLFELDDSEDAEMATLLVNSSRPSPLRPLMATTHTVPGLPISAESCVGNIQTFTKVYRESFASNTALTQTVFNAYFDNVIESICFRARKMQPCVITGLRFDVTIPEEDELQISVLGAVIRLPPPTLPPQISSSSLPLPEDTKVLPQSLGSGGRDVKSFTRTSDNKIVKTSVCVKAVASQRQATDMAVVNGVQSVKRTSDRNSLHEHEEGELIFRMEEITDRTPKKSTALPPTAEDGSGGGGTQSHSGRKITYASSSSSSCGSTSRPLLQHQDHGGSNGCSEGWQGVCISPLPFVPGARIERHLGNLNFFFIRESTCIKESGGVSVFVGSLMTEILGVVRAHVAALGGNAVTSYFMAECILEVNPHKNQGQCLINVGGDVVQTISSTGAATTTNAAVAASSCTSASGTTAVTGTIPVTGTTAATGTTTATGTIPVTGTTSATNFTQS